MYCTLYPNVQYNTESSITCIIRVYTCSIIINVLICIGDDNPAEYTIHTWTKNVKETETSDASATMILMIYDVHFVHFDLFSEL